MSVAELPQPQSTGSPASSRAARASRPKPGLMRQTLGALASLRMTVALLALSIGLVFFGTLAQVDHDVWHVVNHTYFRVWIAQVEFQALARLYEMMSRTEVGPVSGFFVYPGGKLLGSLLALNLIAAHSVRFTWKVKGRKRNLGVALLAVGMAATGAVIASGMDNAVESQLSPEFCRLLWHSLRIATGLAALLGLYGLARAYKAMGAAEWWILAGVVAALVGAAVYLLVDSDFQLDPAGLRILWQLIKGGFAAGVLLMACWILFGKRAGVVLLHGGIGLLMLGEAIVDPVANEANLTLHEGQTKNYTYNMRRPELAVIDQSGEQTDRVTVIPQPLLVKAARSGEPISSDALPFDIRVQDYYRNSTISPVSQAADNPATQGAGLQATAVNLTKAAGTGDNAGSDMPSAYVELTDKASGDSLGVWLVSVYGDEWATTQYWYHGQAPSGQPAPFFQWMRAEHDALNQQRVTHSDKPYHLALRFEREYRDWSLTLNEFTHEQYIGTTTPKNFASNVTLVDPSRGIDRDYRISMNNPLRYAGTAFYQSSFDPVTDAATVLQVVKSRSWMIPYVACMIVGLGMAFHFCLTLGRFIQRRAREAPTPERASGVDWRSPAAYVPAVVAVLCAALVLSKARPEVDQPGQMPLTRLGSLALVDGGRVKPYDTYARTLLQAISNRREIDQRGVDRRSRPACARTLGKVPAIKWMMDSVARADGFTDYRVFRIDNLDLLQSLDLKPRPGSFRYSYAEIMRADEELRKQTELSRQIAEEERTLFQRRVLDLSTSLNRYQVMLYAFDSPPLTSDPSRIQQAVNESMRMAARLRSAGAPRPVPPVQLSETWSTLFEGELQALLAEAQGQTVNPATLALSDTLRSYADGEHRDVTQAIDRLEAALAKHERQVWAPENAAAVAGMAKAEKLDSQKAAFERFFSHFSPFYCASVLYVLAFVTAALSWLFAPRILGRSATAIVAVALVLHVFALIGRVYISGRPPVTNLYSSAVFIGAGAVLLGLVLEAVYRIGIGAVVASVIGFLTLLVAYQLSLDNDTFTVMQAVLDTQFWLATHVVCITLGYSTTFVAGLLGVIYLIKGPLLGRLSDVEAKQITRMTYGTLCFSIVFSFIGTVLGGLWGDDSWGRFWGWDPKENGAVIIVLWIALILHARWGGMVGPRGLAMLSVVGNLVTCWSWFGVNELGVGLHSYGGVSDGLSLEVTVLHVMLWTTLVLLSAVGVVALMQPRKAA